jgi:tetratricopeptide (TPR) repeat protein
MIVRDEEEMLPRCLESVKDYVDEIVIVDTGSVDRTIEIARSYGARVFEQEWTGSFADARNRSFDEATGDWLMFLDADEVLVAEDAPLLRELTTRTWREAFDLTEISFTGDLEDGTAVTHNALRMFRNRPQYRFDGRLHEQIANKLPALPERIESVPVRIEHYGYLGRVRDAKAKSRRNVELLEKQMAEGVDNSFVHFNLGSEYGAIGDAEKALVHFQKAWQMVCADRGPAHYGFTPSLCARLVKALRVNGRLEDAIRQADEGLSVFPGFTDLVLEQAMCQRALGQEERARELFERCLGMGDAPARYTATVGAGTFVAQLALAESHRLLGDSAGAERLLMESLGTYPAFLAVVLPLADLLLARGVSAEEVEQTIVGGLDELTPSARFMLGTALYEAGAVDHAEPHFRTVVEKQPTSAPPRVALAEVLLSQQRYAEAAEVAAAVEEDSPWRPASLVTELVARMLSGDVAGARTALESSGDTLPRGQWAALDACMSVLGEGQSPEALPADAAPTVLTVLEALLRLHEVDAFGALVVLADRVGLSWRAVRESLARMYLRRGFLESAADEWIAVCERGPDAAAYVGLGQIAYARGLHEDAQAFAHEARILDPQDASAEMLAGALAA